jgi:peptide/nickel transport system substrate-binding protein
MALKPYLKTLGAAAALAFVAASSAQAQSTLKIVAQADLKIVDPIITTADVTASHAYNIYDVLFAEGDKFDPKPQMAESWSKSADGLTWSFKLRSGLKFHDGSPVTAKDVVPSLKRWGVKIIGAQIMFSRIADIVATGNDTFEIRFKEAFGPVLEVLSNSGNAAFIMREKEATTDPNTAITENIGSGPFTFVKEEWVPGSKVVYKKNAAYVPRAEAPDGYGGGKVVKVDRLEWMYIPDPATGVQALGAGEVDVMEYFPADLEPMVKSNPQVATRVINKLGNQLVWRPNHLVPPFNNPKVRQVLLYALDQKAFLDVIAGGTDLQKPCWSPYVCGSPLETQAGLGDWSKPGSHKEKAKQLLKESGYKNEPVVILSASDNKVVTEMALITDQALKEVGFNTRLDIMDWSTLLVRRQTRESPETNRAGWNVIFSYAAGNFMGNPITNTTAPTPCDGKNWFGWPCDEQLEKIRQEFLTISTDAQRKDWIDRFQTRFYEVVPYLPVGQYLAKIGYRKNVEKILDLPRMVYWNLEKKS